MKHSLSQKVCLEELYLILKSKMLVALNTMYICTDEVVGFAKAMRKISTKVVTDEKVIDCCGTGGDGINTFNISTCSAFISAASE